jgi:hypothetical protein
MRPLLTFRLIAPSAILRGGKLWLGYCCGVGVNVACPWFSRSSEMPIAVIRAVRRLREGLRRMPRTRKPARKTGQSTAKVTPVTTRNAPMPFS